LRKKRSHVRKIGGRDVEHWLFKLGAENGNDLALSNDTLLDGVEFFGVEFFGVEFFGPGFFDQRALREMGRWA